MYLLGWYLMVPPPDAHWKRRRPGNCEMRSMKTCQEIENSPPNRTMLIASDDPRLKEK